MRLAVVGAGAIGGTIGAFLVRAGHDVTFVDADVDHVAAIRTSGLRIEGPIDAFRVAAPAYVPTEVPGTFETVLLCVKAHVTAAATQDLLPFLAPDGHVVSAQNGLNELVIATIVGRQRTVGCFVNFGADYLEPGVIHYGGRGAVVLGELDGIDTARLRSLVTMFRQFDADAKGSNNIWGFLWAKLAVGSMIFATALTDEGIASCYDMPAYRPVFTAIAREVLAVAEAREVSPEPFDGFDPSAFMPGVPQEVTMRSLDDMVAFNRRSAKIHSGVWRDLAVRKRRTEVDAQLGTIPGLAADVGRETPLVSRIVEMIHEVEHGLRTRSLENLRELDELWRHGAAEEGS
ncbi:oxidoreductase [soil metagenome]